MSRNGLGLIALFLSLASGYANAGTINYTYSTTLSFSSGADDAGLDGASAIIKVSVDASAIYGELFGYPAVPMNDDATVTISGSSQAANNGTFKLPQLTFFPSFAGFFEIGLKPVTTLPVGGDLEMSLSTNPSSAGAGVTVGQTVSLLDFVPATSKNNQWTTPTANYDQLGTILSATTASAVPEPSSLALFGMGAVGLAIGACRGRRAA